MMSEYILCTGENCPLKLDCYRFTGVFYGKQNYFSTPPFDKQLGECRELLSNEHQIRQIAYQLWLDSGKPCCSEQADWLKAKGKILELAKMN